MRERPILFSGPMVRTILDGSKTQSRRVYKAKNGGIWPNARDLPGMRQILRSCPYGQPGDQLWVRENGWQRPELSLRDLREGADTWPPYEYDADPLMCWEDGELKRLGWKRRPSIHMPRWASRISLEITGVRVERLGSISAADAKAEGIEGQTKTGPWRNYLREGYWFPEGRDSAPVLSFASLWQSINGVDSWQGNPWVWVIDFKKLERL